MSPLDIVRRMDIYARTTVYQFKRYLSCTSGATALEYGLIIVGISVAVLAVVFLIGAELARYFNRVDGSVEGALSS